MQVRSHTDQSPLSVVFGGKPTWPLPKAVPAAPPVVTTQGDQPTSTADEALLREVGTTLRRRRTQRGLSLERLSAASGVSRSMLSRVERGESAPTIFTLVHIARALNVELAAILPPSILRPNAPLAPASGFERK